MHTAGGWYVQGVEIAWPPVSGASRICYPWASPHRVSASAHSPWAQAVGTAQDQVWHLGAIWGELRNVSLARLRPCTESWPDFTYIRADYAGATSALTFWQQGASTSARPCSRWSQLCYGAPGLASLDAARRLHLRQNVVALAQSIMAPWEYKISWLVPPVTLNHHSQSTATSSTHISSSQSFATETIDR